MAVIECPECGFDGLVDEDEVCPECGHDPWMETEEVSNGSGK